MNFPNELLKRNRVALDSHRIKRCNYMFARHSPGSEWKAEELWPDFNQIKLDQSFNWSSYSIPIWTRFNERKEYMTNHGVVGYSVSTIISIEKYNPNLSQGILNLTHLPLDTNYSHCELVCTKQLNKTMKRELRMTLKHNARIKIKPFSCKTKLYYPEYINMYIHRLITKIKLIK